MNELKKTPYQDNEQAINATEASSLNEAEKREHDTPSKEEIIEHFRQVVKSAKTPPKQETKKITDIKLDDILKTMSNFVELTLLIAAFEEYKEESGINEDLLNDLYDSLDPSFDDLIEDIKSSVYAKKNKFSEQLKETRTAKGLSQKALSRQTKIPLRTIEAWEAGDRTPPEYVQRLLLNELKRDSE